MSYSLNSPCYNCNKEKTCTDLNKVREAVDKIHASSYDEGHQGGGEILLACFRQNEPNVEGSEVADPSGNR